MTQCAEVELETLPTVLYLLVEGTDTSLIYIYIIAFCHNRTKRNQEKPKKYNFMLYWFVYFPHFIHMSTCMVGMQSAIIRTLFSVGSAFVLATKSLISSNESWKRLIKRYWAKMINSKLTITILVTIVII